MDEPAQGETDQNADGIGCKIRPLRAAAHEGLYHFDHGSVGEGHDRDPEKTPMEHGGHWQDERREGDGVIGLVGQAQPHRRRRYRWRQRQAGDGQGDHRHHSKRCCLYLCAAGLAVGMFGVWGQRK